MSLRACTASHAAAALLVVMVIALPALAQPATNPAPTTRAASADRPPLKKEELEQLLAPIALYPDALITQMLMASTYPVEIVQADRWVKEHKDLKGDALAKELEKVDWDPAVKSLVNFPDQLSMMSEKLDLTIKIGDAFIEQQADVMNTVQVLRNKAQAEGNLKSNAQQKVEVQSAPTTATASNTTVVNVQSGDGSSQAPQTVVQAPPQIITIQSPSPEVVYVPSYNPQVVYGSWPYPAYPPAPYYPPGYIASSAISFGVGVACGAAWGYAWGNSNWGGGDVDIDVNRNANFNTNIDRSKYQQNISNRQTNRQSNQTNRQSNRQSWQHDGSHRKGASYRDQATAQKFGGANQSAQAAKAREQYRGRADAGRQELNRGGANQSSGANSANRGNTNQFSGANSANRGSAGNASANRGTGSNSAGNRAGSASPSQNRSSPSAGNRSSSSSGTRGGAFDGVNRGSSGARQDSQRGQSSRGSSGARSSPSRSSGGASRGGGGGGSRGGGGGGRGGGGGGRR